MNRVLNYIMKPIAARREKKTEAEVLRITKIIEDLMPEEVSVYEVARKIDMRNLASEIDTYDIVEEVKNDLDYSEISDYISLTDLASYIDVDDVVNEIDISEVALHYDTHDISQEFEVSDIASEIDISDLAVHVSDQIIDDVTINAVEQVIAAGSVETEILSTAEDLISNMKDEIIEQVIAEIASRKQTQKNHPKVETQQIGTPKRNSIDSDEFKLLLKYLRIWKSYYKERKQMKTEKQNEMEHMMKAIDQHENRLM